MIDKQPLALIVAMTEKDQVIGKDNSIPWRIPQDLKLFKKVTLDSVVIMGRKTYESIPKQYRPLPKRVNMVLTRSDKEFPGAETYNSLDAALKKASEYNKSIFIIGGSQIYQQALSHCDELHISFIKKDYPGDSQFPQINWDNWDQVEVQDFEEFTYKRFERKQ